MSGLILPELHALVQEEQFGERMLEVSQVTVLEGFEAGFAVYKDRNGLISVSDVLYPDSEYLESLQIVEEELRHLAPQERLAHLLEMLGGSESPLGNWPEINLGRLITNESVEMRTDLAAIAHSHPMLHRRDRDPGGFLIPSSTDLKNYGEQLASNPELITAVIATHRSFATGRYDNIALSLMRPGSDDVIQRLQTVEIGSTVDEGRLAALGLRRARLTFNSRTGRVHSGLASLPRLWGH